MFAASLVLGKSAATSSLPTWDAAMPDPKKLPAAGLQSPKDVKHFKVYSADNTTWGAYNHGPIITQSNDTFFLSWYNGVMDESTENRALFATSSDGEHWSTPSVLFNTTANTHHNSSSVEYPTGYNLGIENEAWVQTEGRLYGMASSWDVFQRRGHGAEHVGPDAALLRRVHISNKSPLAVELGPVFWLADTVPAGFDTYCNITYHDVAAVGAISSADATKYRARLISTVPPVDAGEPNERSMYHLKYPPTTQAAHANANSGMQDLVMLLRTGNTSAPVMWASRCSVPVNISNGMLKQEQNADIGVCKPGTGIYNFAPLPSNVLDVLSVDCEWSVPAPTNIPDSHTRTCASLLPDGRRWLVGSQLPQAGLRSPLTLSLSDDGLSWNKVWSLRGADTLPKIRFHGYPGFQYPSGMWVKGELLVAYSVNKEDIAITKVTLDQI